MVEAWCSITSMAQRWELLIIPSRVCVQSMHAWYRYIIGAQLQHAYETTSMRQRYISCHILIALRETSARHHPLSCSRSSNATESSKILMSMIIKVKSLCSQVIILGIFAASIYEIRHSHAVSMALNSSVPCMNQPTVQLISLQWAVQDKSATHASHSRKKCLTDSKESMQAWWLRHRLQIKAQTTPHRFTTL